MLMKLSEFKATLNLVNCIPCQLRLSLSILLNLYISSNGRVLSGWIAGYRGYSCFDSLTILITLVSVASDCAWAMSV